MRNPYTRPGGMFGRRAAGGFTRASADAPAGPTVILNAAYLTDTLLDQGQVPITNGGELDSWAFATGGTADYTYASLAGAGARPIYVAASGVHTAGGSAALTTATPVTIPADADCVIYVRCVFASSFFIPLGKAGANDSLEMDDEVGIQITGAVGAAYFSGYPSAGTYLYRFRRVSNVWKLAYTGVAEADSTGGTLAGGAVSFDTLLASIGAAGYSASGNYLQKAYIYHGSSTPDTTYETNNGGTL